ncbi:hypothetical protein [Sphingomonas sp.]|uniref:hypothetical protein n=1 Tax=Sphingomonas sp. TaxID=28214 RepID=UPI0038A71E88
MDEPLTSKPVRGTETQEISHSSPSNPCPSATNDGWTVEKQYAFTEALAEQPRARTRVGSLRLLRFGRIPRVRTRRTVNIVNIRAQQTRAVTTNIREHSRLSPLLAERG